MILYSAAMASTCRPLLRPICFASNSNINTDQLRSQLDQLHAEAETTRDKASSARLRFLRLSESAENLKRQAAISVNSGKENEARDLLYQKKKVMQAMERSKSRIELLDELSAKLNEAISIQESQLIGNIAFDLQVNGEDISGPVHIISPKKGLTDGPEADKNNPSDAFRPTKSQDSRLSTDDRLIPTVDKELVSVSGGDCKDTMIRGLESISSYEDFLERLDIEVNRIEVELVTILNVSALVLNSKEKPTNSRVQQTVELLESIRAIRQKIRRIMQMELEEM